MNADETNCPYCGAEVDYYFEETEPEDWTVTVPFPEHCGRAVNEGWECGDRSHTEFTTAEYEIQCRECDEMFMFSCTYAQPCNANGYVIEMKMRKIEDSDNETAK